MTAATAKIASLPLKIWQVMHGSWAEQALRSGVELNLFGALEDGPVPADAVANQLDIDRRATEMLLDALTGLGFITKSQNKYALTEDSRTYLVPSSPLYMGKFLVGNIHVNSSWAKLTDTVRSGKPAVEVNTDKKAEEFFPQLAEGIFPLSYAMAQLVAQELKVSQLPAGAKVLDVAAGAGTWSIPMAEDNKNLHVDALDFPAIIEVTKKTTAKLGVGDRYGYIVGNWRNVSWQKENYDVVILGHILHSEGLDLSKQLIDRCYDVLKPGGAIVVAEMIANNDRSGPPSAMLFGVNMLMNTTQGCVFTEQELFDILTKAKFEKPYHMRMENNPESPVVIARKPQ